MKAAIFPTCVGTNYKLIYDNIFKSGFENYCTKYNYDLIVLDETFKIPETYNSQYILWLKFYVPFSEMAQQYDYIMLVDYDILINPQTPPFHLLPLNGKIGIVDEFAQPSTGERLAIQKANNWEPNAEAYYKLCDLTIDTDMVFNSGMIICQPKLHGNFFRQLIDTHLTIFFTHRRGDHYEQGCLGYELQKQDMYTLLPNEWNKIWFLYKNSNAENKSLIRQFFDQYNQSYLFHLAGHTDYNFGLHLKNKLL